MKRLFLTIHLVCFAIVLSAQIYQTIDIPIEEVKLKEKGIYHKIEYGYSSYSDSIGYPHIPIVIKAYAIPLDAKTLSLQIITCETETLYTNITLYPIQHTQTDNDSNESFIKPYSIIYSSSNEYPNTVAQIVKDELVMGYRIVSVAYYPFAYIPREKVLYKRRIETVLNYSSNDNSLFSASIISPQRRRIARQFVASIVENGDIVLNYNPKTSLMRTSSNQSVLNDVVPDYLIITNNELKNEYRKLADWKTKKGVLTFIKTIEEIKHEYTGADLIDKIENFITDFSDKWGDIGLYVLLGGDSDIIPTRLVRSENSTDLIATDASFVDKSFYIKDWRTRVCNGGSKNRNIFIGRFPFSKPQETRTFINKLLHYEKSDQNIDYSYLNNLLMISAFMKEGDIDGYMKEFDKYRLTNFPTYGKYWYLFDHFNCTCDEHRFITYDGTYGSELNRENFLSALHEGTNQGFPHFICHKDHGFSYSFGTSSKSKKQNVSNANIWGIKDSMHLNIILSGSCHTANFIDNCVGENFLRRNTIAYIGNTDVGWRDEYPLVETFLFNLFTRKESFHLGFIHCKLIFDLSKLYRTFHRLHLLGDPEMPIWTNVPQNLDVTVSPATRIVASWQEPTTIKVRVNNLPAGETATVCIMKDTEVYKVMEIADTLEHKYQCTPLTEGTMHVTVTAHNFRPNETAIPVVRRSPVLSIENVEFLSGNDGIISPGEDVQLRVTLKNNGMAAVSGVEATMATPSPYITFVRDQLSCGKIESGATRTFTNTFRFHVATDAPEILRNDFNGTTFHLRMVKDDLGPDVDTFRVDLIPPKYKFVSHKRTGPATLTAGSSHIFISEIANLGKIEANPRMEIIPETAGVDTIIYAGNGRWRVTIADNYQIGTSVKLRVNLYGNNILSDSHVIELQDEKLTVEASSIGIHEDEKSVTLYWTMPSNAYGYHVYRSMTPTSGYTRLNKMPLTGEFFIDENLEANTPYYYKVSAVNQSFVEGNMSSLIKTHTLCGTMEGFPLHTGGLHYFMQTPTTVDVDYDGQKEIVAMGWDVNSHDSKAMILRPDGRELYDIDATSYTINGFANLIYYLATPAVADVYGNGEPCVVVLPNLANGKVCCYSSIDKNGDNKPDSLWTLSTNSGSWENAVITDLDSPNGKGEKEIITLGNPAARRLTVIDCHGKKKWQVGGLEDTHVAAPAIADLDEDGYKEIIFGDKDKIYIRKHDGSIFGDSTVFFTSPNGELLNSTPIVCDFDGDGNKDILIASCQAETSYIFAIRPDGTCFNGFDGDLATSASIYYYDTGGRNHSLSVGDIDTDGKLEVVALGKNYVKAWNNDGTLSFSRYITGVLPSTDTFVKNMSPVLADVDGNESIDIVFSIENNIYAIDNTGNNLKGFPLKTSSMVRKGVTVSDIDNDSLNEIIAGDNAGKLYVWKTLGKSTAIEWGRAQFDTENTSEYISGYKDPWVITSNTTWAGGTFTNDIIVRSGTFTIPQGVTLDMRKPYRIYVMNGGTLNLTGGSITNADILVKSGGTLNVSGNSQIILRSTGGNLNVDKGAVMNIPLGIIR